MAPPRLAAAFERPPPLTRAPLLPAAGYLLATGLILWASMTDLKRGSDQQVLNLTSIVVYQLLGVLFLEIARVVNDKLLLRKIDNNYALIVKHNVAVGCAEAGSYVGTGLIVMGAISGPVTSWGNDLATSCLFFVLGQVHTHPYPPAPTGHPLSRPP